MALMKWTLVEDLRYGSLKAVGYCLPRGVTDGPVFIPPDVWFGHVEWGKNEVHGAGLSFVTVRICDERWFSVDDGVDEDGEADLDASLPADPFPVKFELPADCGLNLPEMRKVGRPSARDVVLQAYASIEKDYSKPLSAHISAIQQKAMSILNTKSDKNLKEDAIRTAIGKKFRLEKEVWKTSGKS
jgi:hypothetical protein